MRTLRSRGSSVHVERGTRERVTLDKFGAPAWICGRIDGVVTKHLSVEAVPGGLRFPPVSLNELPLSGISQ